MKILLLLLFVMFLGTTVHADDRSQTICASVQWDNMNVAYLENWVECFARNIHNQGDAEAIFGPLKTENRGKSPQIFGGAEWRNASPQNLSSHFTAVRVDIKGDKVEEIRIDLKTSFPVSLKSLKKPLGESTLLKVLTFHPPPLYHFSFSPKKYRDKIQIVLDTYSRYGADTITIESILVRRFDE